jgi:DNA-directed RNA polymerase subunit RPC12/RpoP
MRLFKRKKYKCLICEKRVGENVPSVKYRYAENQIGEAKLCQKCANKFEKSNVDMEDRFDEPF